MSRIMTFLVDLFGAAPRSDGRVAALEEQLAQAARETAVADAQTARWRKRCEAARDYARSADAVAADRLGLLDRARVVIRALQGQVDELKAEVEDAHGKAQAMRQRVGELEAQAAKLQLADVGQLVGENARLRRALWECEDAREQQRREIEQLEAERAQPGSDRWK